MSVTETGTRAREPDERGFAATDDGLRLYWEVHGSGSPTLVFLLPARNSCWHESPWQLPHGAEGDLTGVAGLKRSHCCFALTVCTGRR